MCISHIRIENVRCIKNAEIQPHPKFSLLCGPNGSGKSSFLEAVFLLGLARSFRTNNIKKLITDSETECRVVAKYIDRGGGENRIGISRNRESNTLIRLNQHTLKTSSELARVLPVRIISQDSFGLIDGPSKGRRQFIDWLAFHVEHQFNGSWVSVQRLLKQRNALLKQSTRFKPAELSIWDEELVYHATQLDKLRRKVFDEYLAHFSAMVKCLLPSVDISTTLYKGWPEQLGLASALRANIERDLKLGYTHCSPNRADMQLKVGTKLASECLSRGEKKLLICALTLAQIITFSKLKDEQKSPSIVLVDDIGAELDGSNRHLLFETLDSCGSQVFVTGTDSYRPKTFLAIDSYKMFHVEQGSITPA